MIKLVRVDYRLLHGQVGFSWNPYLGTDAILLVSDTLLDDPLRVQSTKLAKPTGVKVIVKTLDESIKAINSGVTDKYKVFVVCETVQDACKLIKETGLKHLNLGETLSKEERQKISMTIFIDENDKKCLDELDEEGINIEIQVLPSNPVTKYKDAIKNYK